MHLLPQFNQDVEQVAALALALLLVTAVSAPVVHFLSRF